MWSIGLRSPLGVFDTDVTFNLLMTVHFNFYDMIDPRLYLLHFSWAFIIHIKVTETHRHPIKSSLNALNVTVKGLRNSSAGRSLSNITAAEKLQRVA